MERAKSVRLAFWIAGFAISLFIVSLSISFARQSPLSEKGGVGHSQQVYRQLQAILIATLEAETGQRGYVITGDRAYLKPYSDAGVRLNAHLKSLALLTRDNPAQQQRITRLTTVLDGEFAALRETLDALDNGGKQAAIEKVQSHINNQALEQSRAIVQEMEDEEDKLLAKRDSDATAIFYLFTIATLFITFRDVFMFAYYWDK
jgi:methyl-accepting chemotaxis protein